MSIKNRPNLNPYDSWIKALGLDHGNPSQSGLYKNLYPMLCKKSNATYIHLFSTPQVNVLLVLDLSNFIAKIIYSAG